MLYRNAFVTEYNYITMHIYVIGNYDLYNNVKSMINLRKHLNINYFKKSSSYRNGSIGLYLKR